MKDAFQSVCKSDFNFMKFHMVLHVPEQIRKLGNLDIVDANRQKTWFHMDFCFDNYNILSFPGGNTSMLKQQSVFIKKQLKELAVWSVIWKFSSEKVKSTSTCSTRSSFLILYGFWPILIHFVFQMGISSYLSERNPIPKFLDSLYDESTDILHYWKPMNKGRDFAPTTAMVEKLGLSSALARKVRILYCTKPVFILVLSQFPRYFTKAWAAWADDDNDNVPHLLVHHRSIVVQGPHGLNPQILRADAEYRASNCPNTICNLIYIDRRAKNGLMVPRFWRPTLS